jgi:tetraacyldisaccharide 4'-kinase
VLEGTERSGDEPQLLARTLTGVPVLVSTSRYEAGQVAESRFGCTVLLLDDGFQHLTLARDVDLLLMALPDLEDRVLPFGRLREPLASARYADALLVPGTAGDAARMSAALGVIPAFTVETRYLPPARVTPYGEPIDLPAGTRVVAVAGIARPHRFFSALRDHGWQVTQEIVFPDHHWFRERDLRRAAAEARRSRADLILTTEKDAVRLDGRPTDVTWAYLPMRAAVEPAGEFAAWIAGRLAAARRKAT